MLTVHTRIILVVDALIIIIIRASTMAAVHACPIAMMHACTTLSMHACVIILIQACTTVIFYACFMATVECIMSYIAHVPSHSNYGLRGGGGGADTPRATRGLRGSRNPPMRDPQKDVCICEFIQSDGQSATCRSLFQSD